MIGKRSIEIFEYFKKKYINTEIIKHPCDNFHYLIIENHSINLTLLLLENKNVKSVIRKIEKDIRKYEFLQ